VELSTTLAMLRESTARLLSAAAALDDEAVRQPSRLPGWSRGHVLTHLARNADAVTNLLTWARTGVETPMYVSRERRDADIEAGSRRPAGDLVADVAAGSRKFEAALDAMTPSAWQRQVRAGATNRMVPADWVPLARLGELEIHHSDLDVGYRPSQWPAAWAGAFLPGAGQGLEERAGEPLRLLTLSGEMYGAERSGARTVTGDVRELLAWVVGRADGSALSVTPAGPLPELGRWR
jgi:maleylpyruvate isomerase